MFIENSITYMLRKKRKWDQIKYWINPPLLHPPKNQKGNVEDKNRNKDKDSKWKTVTDLVAIHPKMLKITMNDSSSNIPIKRHCQSGSKNKTKFNVVYKKPTLYKHTYR